MAKIAVLTGNGLSIALNSVFSIPNITEEFFKRLRPEHRAFVESHMTNGTDESNFEECIATIETFYDALHNHVDFLRKDVHGSTFANASSLNVNEIMKHEEAIRETIHLFMALIQEIVDGNVKTHLIKSKLPGFVQWLLSIIRGGNDVDLFTLNYDLLLEKILLDHVGTENFMEYFDRGGGWHLLNPDVPRIWFNPEKAIKKKAVCRTKLYHLHGSLSSFKDLKKQKTFKVTTEVIRKYHVYNRISELKIVPSIITGGRKSDKIQEMPFAYYFDAFTKKMGDEDHLCDELYIIGYGFGDEHINRAISERLKIAHRSIHSQPVKLVIVDYTRDAEDRVRFTAVINKALGLEEGVQGRFVKNDPRLLFGGANSIQTFVQPHRAV